VADSGAGGGRLRCLLPSVAVAQAFSYSLSFSLYLTPSHNDTSNTTAGEEESPALEVEAIPSVTDALYDDTPMPKMAANMRIEPLELQWVRIGCSYRAATGTKVVLQEVYGKASPGEMQVRLKRGDWASKQAAAAV